MFESRRGHHHPSPRPRNRLTFGWCFRRPVLAVCVQAGIGQHQALHWPSSDDVGLDDFVHISECDPSVPNRVGVDHNIRTVFALIETTRLVGPYFSFQSSGCQFFFERLLQLGATSRIATGTGRSRRALIAANENMFLKLWHR